MWISIFALAMALFVMVLTAKADEKSLRGALEKTLQSANDATCFTSSSNMIPLEKTMRYTPGGICWKVDGYTGIYQSDGNLVAYDNQGKAKWASNTVGSVKLAVGSKKVCIYNSNQVIKWCTPLMMLATTQFTFDKENGFMVLDTCAEIRRYCELVHKKSKIEGYYIMWSSY